MFKKAESLNSTPHHIDLFCSIFADWKLHWCYYKFIHTFKVKSAFLCYLFSALATRICWAHLSCFLV